MPEQQLHLFESARPLLQRFGHDFFRAVPSRPGIYIMGGEAGRILYIGKSGNLRHRLGSYKNARPDHAPRKVIRLVHSVRTIVWEECETEAAACLRENQLLRTHHPRFNVVNTWPRAYAFIHLKLTDDGLNLGLSRELKSGEDVYGAFKHGCAQACQSLARSLWISLHQPASLFDLPAQLLGSQPPRECRVPVASSLRESWPGWIASVQAYLRGKSADLLARLTEVLPTQETVPAFQRNLQAADLEILTSFFERGPKRLHDIRQRHGFDSPVIPQEELDDWLVLAARS